MPQCDKKRSTTTGGFALHMSLASVILLLFFEAKLPQLLLLLGEVEDMDVVHTGAAAGLV